MTELTSIVERYLQAVNDHDIAAMASCFAPDAVVHDEGGEYHGIPSIAGWIETTTEKYNVTVEVTDVQEQDGKTIVTNRVTGTFDGSPIVLQHRFTRSNDKITALTIT